LLFFTRMRDTRSALSRIDDIAGSEMRNAVAENDLIEMVRTDKNRKVEQDYDPDNTNAQENVTTSTLPPISIGRAYQKTQEIQGQAEAEATRIYAEAYNQSPQALELYSFLRSMQTLEEVATNNTTLVISTDGDLFKYLKSADAK
jgi:regulator of protease activity HflC (stomatin/prohibitin superfamily)